MKFLKLYFLIFTLILVNIDYSFAANHFTFNTNTDNTMIIVVGTDANPKIGNEALANGDEIGVFTPGGVCVGGIVWAGQNDAITVFGFNSSSNTTGAKPGDALSFRVWDASEQVELTSVSVTFSDNDLIFTNFDNKYAVNGFAGLTSLVAAKKPGKPSFTNPTNNAVGVALSGNLTWNAAPGATSHTIELSTVNNFTTKIIEQSGNFTTFPYSGLSNNTTYFARALGTNAEGNGDFETISFKTLLATPTLANPADNAKGLTETSVNLSWNSVSGATSYKVQIATNNTFTTGLVEQTVNVTNATFNGLNVFTDYFWRVMAMDGANSSAFSAVRTFKTRVGTTTITNPANTAVGVALSGNIQWTAVTGATSYDVQLIKLPNTNVLNQNVTTTQLAFSNLDNLSNYEIRVTAKNADGSGAMVTSTFKTILGVPALISPANNSFNNGLSGTLTWGAVTGAATYDLRVATDAGFNNLVVNQNDIAGTSFAYNGFSNNQKYFWQVRAKNNEGTGSFSSSFGFTTLLATATLVSPANNETLVPLNATLQWNSVAGATSYHVQVATNSNFTSIFFENTSVNGTSVVVNNLAGKTNYFFRVKGFNSNNEGGFSTPNMFTTMLSKVVLTSPANLSEGNPVNGTLNWQSLQGATAYELLVSTNSDLSNPVINNTNVATNSFNYSGLNNNTTYFWAVRGKDNLGTGAYSDIFSFTTQVLAPNLISPSNNETNVVLQGACTWSAVTGANTYQLQIATDVNFNNVVFNLSGIVGTTGNYTGLQNNTTHFWRVRGFKGNGAGLWSGTFQFKTMTLAPPNPIFPPNNSIDLYTSVNFVWSSVTEATGYNFRYATDENMINVLQTVNNLSNTNYILNNLFIEYTYYWQVQTIGAQGVSNWSPAQKFTTIFPIEITGVETICENKQSTYSTRVSPLIDYKWTVTGGTIVGSSTGTSVNVNWGSAGVGSVKLTRESAAWGNYSDNQTKNVTKTSVANVDVALSANTYYQNKACLNEMVNLNAVLNSNGSFTYSWILNNNVVSTNKSFNYHFHTVGTYNFTFTATGTDCEAAQASITVVVDGNCPVTIVNDDEIYTCKNSSPILTTKVFGGSGQYSYNWTPSSDFVNASVVSPIVKSAAFTKNYYLVVKDLVSGVNTEDLLQVIVRESPTFTFSPASVTVKNNNPIDLTDPSFLSISVSGGQAPYIYNWKNEARNPIDATNIYPNNGVNRYYLTVVDDLGCESVEKRFTVIKAASKDGVDYEFTSGMTGAGVLVVYPNPVVSDLNIVADFETKQNVKIRIVNLIGQEVYSNNAGMLDILENSIGLSHLNSGVYTLIVETENNTFVKPFVKQ